MNEADLNALKTIGRLEALGVLVRSPELRDRAQELVEFNGTGGNRAMRRAADRRRRKRGR